MEINMVPEEELLLQTAEEAAELAAAAARLIRVRRGINQSAAIENRAESNLLEEMADVKLCIDELSRKEGGAMVFGVIYADRKKKRLEERNASA